MLLLKPVPAAQRSATPSFLFNDACQKTSYSAPNMWLARGQGLAADRLTNRLASNGFPLHEQQLASPRRPVGVAEASPAWPAKASWRHSLCHNFPTCSLPFSCFFYSSLIPSVFISPQTPAIHCPHLHMHTLHYPQSYPPLTPHSLLATALVFSPQTVKLLGTVVFMYYLSFLLSICSFTQGNLPSIHMAPPKLLLQSTPCPPWCKSNHHFSLRSRI